MRGRRLLFLLLAAACAGNSTGVSTLEPGGRHVLFIGNSLTYVNDLPATVRDLAASVGDTVRVRMVAGPDLAVIDHVNGATDAMSVLRGERWDVVVIQQGPTTRALDRDTLILAAKRLTPDVVAAGARLAQLMPWPPSSRLAAFDSVRTTCDIVAATTGARCIAAGSAWRAMMTADPTVPLYGLDGFHPAPAGTYLAALMVYEEVTGRDARLLPAVARVNGGALALPEATVRLLQRTAHDARIVP